MHQYRNVLWNVIYKTLLTLKNTKLTFTFMDLHKVVESSIRLLTLLNYFEMAPWCILWVFFVCGIWPFQFTLRLLRVSRKLSKLMTVSFYWPKSPSMLLGYYFLVFLPLSGNFLLIQSNSDVIIKCNIIHFWARVLKSSL